MTTRQTGLFALAALGFAGAGAAITSGSGQADPGIRGTFDPATRSFTPLAPHIEKTTALAPKTVKGTFKLGVSVKIDPKIPTKVKLYANVAITAQDPDTFSPALRYVLNVGDYLTRSGDAGTLNLTVPYVYKLADPNASVTFVLTIYEPSGGTKFQPTSVRTSTIPLPKNGTTTAVTLGETI